LRRDVGPGFSRAVSRIFGLALAFTVLVTVPGVADVIVARQTSHLSFIASLSPDTVKAGGRLSLIVNITPKKRMHVYAPGTTYRAVTVTLNKNPALKPSRLVYPKPSIYIFKPLQEQVLVYSDPFKLTMDIAVGKVPTKGAPLKITGTLNYQACDDRVCYLPESVPLEWTIPVKQ
jgi:DsbC/DsbD-like thiol-disulfide interchange protein